MIVAVWAIASSVLEEHIVSIFEVEGRRVRVLMVLEVVRGSSQGAQEDHCATPPRSSCENIGPAI